MLHRSSRRFSSGVPVSARRWSDLQLLHRLGHLRAGVLDELRLVQDDGAEGELLQLLQVAPQQGVVGDDEVVLRDLLAQVVARGAALQHQHLQVRREAVGLAPPVVQHRGGADHQRRLGVLPVPVLEPRQPGQRLQGLAQAHVVREDAAQPDAASGGRGSRSRPSDRAASPPAPSRAVGWRGGPRSS